MTIREFYEAVVNANVSDELTEFATTGIAKLDATNAKRREKAAAKANVNQEFVDKLVSMLGDEAKTATELKDMFAAEGITVINDKEVTVQKISSLARVAVESGKVAKVDVKVKGKGTQKAYILA